MNINPEPFITAHNIAATKKKIKQLQMFKNVGHGFNRNYTEFRDIGATCVNGCFHLWQTIPMSKPILQSNGFFMQKITVLRGKGGCRVCASIGQPKIK